jgi:hypothetical protein
MAENIFYVRSSLNLKRKPVLEICPHLLANLYEVEKTTFVEDSEYQVPLRLYCAGCKKHYILNLAVN